MQKCAQGSKGIKSVYEKQPHILVSFPCADAEESDIKVVCSWWLDRQSLMFQVEASVSDTGSNICIKHKRWGRPGSKPRRQSKAGKQIQRVRRRQKQIDWEPNKKGTHTYTRINKATTGDMTQQVQQWIGKQSRALAYGFIYTREGRLRWQMWGWLG